LPNDIVPPQTERADAPAGRVIPQDPEALLYQAEASYLMALSERTLEAYRLKGGGPPFTVIGKRGVRYRRGDLIEWIATRRRRSTSDPGREDSGAEDHGGKS
jgi:hypothetical protein